jgi:hypothetical protein
VLDFDVQRFTRRCAKTGREFDPGETFYSVLLVDGSNVLRRDYCAQAWEGPVDEALAWWKSQVPDLHAKKPHWAPSDVLLHYFTQLEQQTDREDTRYVLALLMIRRRILRLEEAEVDQQGRETMMLYCPRNETEYQVQVTALTDQRVAEIQNELANLLWAHGK